MQEQHPPQAAAQETEKVDKGAEVVAFATQFVGNPYKYGGTSLTGGADCSGFVMSVFKQFGIELPRTSREQGRAGTEVGGLENAVPGDIISYKGHIGIYIGQNQLVHASNERDCLLYTSYLGWGSARLRIRYEIRQSRVLRFKFNLSCSPFFHRKACWLQMYRNWFKM